MFDMISQMLFVTLKNKGKCSSYVAVLVLSIVLDENRIWCLEEVHDACPWRIVQLRASATNRKIEI